MGNLVPGAAAEPLHRLVNTAQQQANRDAAAATCKDVWNTYDGTKLNCDEYPFSSTVEGAAKGDRRYSARLIPSADNQKAGSMLNSTFTANRVLDGDAFSVSVTA